jgi:hypothetical protein
MSPVLAPDAAVVSAVAALLVSAFTVGGTWWFGRRADGYSHLRDTISELGAAGNRDARAVAWLWFAPSGLLFAVAAMALGEALGTDDAQRAAFPLALVGVGWIGAAIFPCDPGAPALGTIRNHLHNLTGGGAYLAGAAGLFEMGRALEDSQPFIALLARAAGAVVLLGLFFISLPEVPLRGLVQRVMEALLHGWLLLAAAIALTLR